MDVTHYNEFGNQKYIHVYVDTYSGFFYATLQTGEASKHVITHNANNCQCIVCA